MRKQQFYSVEGRALGVLARQRLLPGNEQKRYADYVAWCRQRGLPPAPFQTWKETVAA